MSCGVCGQNKAHGKGIETSFKQSDTTAHVRKISFPSQIDGDMSHQRHAFTGTGTGSDKQKFAARPAQEFSFVASQQDGRRRQRFTLFLLGRRFEQAGLGDFGTVGKACRTVQLAFGFGKQHCQDNKQRRDGHDCGKTGCRIQRKAKVLRQTGRVFPVARQHGQGGRAFQIQPTGQHKRAEIQPAGDG